MSRSKLLNLPVPKDEQTATALRGLVATHEPLAVEAQVEAHVDEIDGVVGTEDLANHRQPVRHEVVTHVSGSDI
jgi:hypothetical protein